MRLLYTKPVLRDLLQDSRVAFVGQLRLMSQHPVADILDFIYTLVYLCFYRSIYFIR